uniref:SJCHGC02796 protein n=1 Tax=Schistosoma japonicum TaxID=6182 RepID=Q5DD99_SCHJA|nr:SJCHGC02796 protein [Schistosoma japonicum]
MDHSYYRKSPLEINTPTRSTGFLSPFYSVLTDCSVKSGSSNILDSNESSDCCSDFLSDLSTSRSPDPREEYNLFLSDFVPDDVLDFVTDYSVSVRSRHVIHLILICHVRRYIGDDQLHHLPQTNDFENAESRLSDVLRNSHENDFSKSGSSSSDRKSPIKQSTHSKRRREINREASKRYRQRLKQKSLQTRLDLTSVISAYEQSKSAYEKAEHTFDVLKNIVLDLVNIVPRK